MTDTPEGLLPCRECGEPCRVWKFGRTSLWVCSAHKKLGGDCPSDMAYTTEHHWNAHPSPVPQDIDARERLVTVEEHHERSGGKHSHWYEVRESGRYLCSCCDPDDAEMIRAGLSR